MPACKYLVLMFIYIFIHLLLYYNCSNLFSVEFINQLVMQIFRNTFSLEFYNYEIQNFLY